MMTRNFLLGICTVALLVAWRNPAPAAPAAGALATPTLPQTLAGPLTASRPMGIAPGEAGGQRVGADEGDGRMGCTCMILGGRFICFGSTCH